jgi:mannonate dehydratase
VTYRGAVTIDISFRGRGRVVSEFKITNVKTICTAPNGLNMVAVKVETNIPGLYGVGCATFPQQPLAVVAAVENYIKPFVLGRNPDEIEEIWQAAYYSSYFRSGPVTNNALSGLDQALWDIKGKKLGVPVYQLLGGKCRPAAEVYVHLKSDDPAQMIDLVQEKQAAGFRYFRIQSNTPSRLAMDQGIWDSQTYYLATVRMFEQLRKHFGPEVRLLHDIHERPSPIASIKLAKALEPYDLFFLEDPFAPEDNEWFRILRAQSAIPLASGEAYVNQQEYVPLIRDRLIDYIRVHVSMIGGLTPARKLAALAEFFGVKTAWHGTGDMTPIGHMAQLHLELASFNFGIKEAHLFNEQTYEVFPGSSEIRDGFHWATEKPGFGIDIDEELAARYPLPDHPYGGLWPEVRSRDGAILRP